MRIISFIFLIILTCCHAKEEISRKVFYHDELENRLNIIEEKTISFKKNGKGDFEYDGVSLKKVEDSKYIFGNSLVCRMKDGNNVIFKNINIGCYYCNDSTMVDEEAFSFISDKYGILMIKGLQNFVFFGENKKEKEIHEFLYLNYNEFDLSVIPLPPEK